MGSFSSWRHTMAKGWGRVFALGLLVSLSACNRPGGIPDGVGISVSNNTLSVGDDVEIRFTFGGLSGGAGDSLSAFDVDIIFDPNILTFKSASFVDPESEINQLGLTEEGVLAFEGSVSEKNSGVLDAFGVSGNSGAVLDGSQSDAFAYLLLTFNASAAAAETVVQIDQADAGLLFVNSANSSISPTIANSSVTVKVEAP